MKPPPINLAETSCNKSEQEAVEELPVSLPPKRKAILKRSSTTDVNELTFASKDGSATNKSDRYRKVANRNSVKLMIMNEHYIA